MAVLSSDFLATLNEKIINPAFDIARSNIQGIYQVVSMGTPVQPEGGYKFGWTDLKVDAAGSTINGAKLSTDTTITVTSGTSFRAGMLVSIKGSNEVILVTAVSGNNLTVTRGFGGTTAAAISDGASLIIDSIGREENSTGVDDTMVEPILTQNYFQTLDTQLSFSRRALAQAQIGNYNEMAFQLDERIKQLTIQLNRMLIRGVKGTATIGGKTVTYSGGMTYWLNQSGGYTVDNSAATLTLGAIDSIVEQIVLRGGMTDTIAVSTKQARVLQGLVNANYQSVRLSESQTDRGALTMLSSDLPILGQINRIVVDTNLNDNELIMFDSSKLKIIPMASGNANADGNWRTLNATQNGQDGEALRIVGDFGIEFRNWKTNAARLTNIG